MKAELKEKEWISVWDALPRDQRSVLVISFSGNMAINWYNQESKAWYPGGLPLCNSSYWMPLPDKPEEFTLRHGGIL